MSLSSICVYCGSSSGKDPAYAAVAEELGRMIAREGMTLVYGGCSEGLMGTVADAALAEGGKVIGVITESIKELEMTHEGLMELHSVEDMSHRKDMLAAKSDAFIALPGGFGTLDEFFDITTQRYLELHDKPIVLLNAGGYWDRMLRLVDQMIDQGFAKDVHRKGFRVASTPAEAFEKLKEESASSL